MTLTSPPSSPPASSLPTSPPATSPLAALPPALRALPLDALHQLARYQRALAFSGGLAVTSPDGTARTPIPPVLTPVILHPDALALRAHVAATLTEAVHLTTRWLLGSPATAHTLLDAMAPVERAIIAHTWPTLDRVPNVRVDFFIDHQHHPWALEVNATIPAMQAYSDIAAESWIRAVAAARTLPASLTDSLIERNGSNRDALLQALLAAYDARGGDRPSPTIGLCARRHDAQLTELASIAQWMRARGYPAFIVHPEDLSTRGASMYANGQRIDLLYRHLFARYLQPDMPLAEILRHPDKFMVFNPVNAQLEIKRALGELSAAAHDPTRAAAIGLSPHHLDVVRRFVPWTRHLSHGPTTGPDGAPIQDLVKFIQEDPARWVIKRSWDYGGRAVFIGPHWDHPATQQRALDYTQNQLLSWPALVARCAADPVGGGFVVQAHVASPTTLMTSADPDGNLSAAPMYVDFSAYASLGVPPPPWGGVCRASPASVVNIVGGGGVAPLLRADVAAALLD